MISIYLNGEPKEVPEGLTLLTLVNWLELPADRVAIELNERVVPRRQWAETPVAGGDRLEVVNFVGGGSQIDDCRLAIERWKLPGPGVRMRRRRP